MHSPFLFTLKTSFETAWKTSSVNCDQNFEYWSRMYKNRFPIESIKIEIIKQILNTDSKNIFVSAWN